MSPKYIEDLIIATQEGKIVWTSGQSRGIEASALVAGYRIILTLSYEFIVWDSRDNVGDLLETFSSEELAQNVKAQIARNRAEEFESFTQHIAFLAGTKA
jgi:hypothetical protein